ncbi:hypothetical protein AQJ11_37500 [Streptomyces corchorusii]|uniref:Uncharacterized protein n=2 Tax=Streptomyces TaxID=1883 RepID=A0A101PTV3_STRCK|nr:hypothetical protein AQJ11_37500 [Streptomyces corchorusii]
MSRTPDQIRSSKRFLGVEWPPRAQEVSHLGDACTVHGSDDFHFADLRTVRGRFPGRHVTLDGEVITV